MDGNLATDWLNDGWWWLNSDKPPSSDSMVGSTPGKTGPTFATSDSLPSIFFYHPIWFHEFSIEVAMDVPG